jgi:hypothetical protein
MMSLNYTADEDELLQVASVVVFSRTRSLTDLVNRHEILLQLLRLLT